MAHWIQQIVAWSRLRACLGLAEETAGKYSDHLCVLSGSLWAALELYSISHSVIKYIVLFWDMI